MYTVYVLTSPDGKKYVGTTSMKPELRWRSGHGYKNKVMASALKQFPWKLWKKEIIIDGISKESAYDIEK